MKTKLLTGVLLLSILLTGCKGVDAVTTPPATEATITAPVASTTAKPDDEPIVGHCWEIGDFFYFYDDFEQAYREFSSVNPVSIMIPRMENTEYTIVSYMFEGDYIIIYDKKPDNYAIKSNYKAFEFHLYGSLEKLDPITSQEDRYNLTHELGRNYDYAVFLYCHIQTAPVLSSDDLELVLYEGDNPDPIARYDEYEFHYMDSTFDWDPQTTRRYDIVQGDTVLISFFTQVRQGGEELHDRLCEMVMEDLVCLNGEGVQ